MISLKKGIKSLSKNILHEYYTPKPTKFQGILVIFTIFVNYADFYVNAVMLTDVTAAAWMTIVLRQITISSVNVICVCTKCCFCKTSCIISQRGKNYLPLFPLCTT